MTKNNKNPKPITTDEFKIIIIIVIIIIIISIDNNKH